MNLLGITTWLSNEIHIVTNRVKRCRLLKGEVGYVLHPPRAHLTEENINYFRFLDLVELLPDASCQVDNPYAVFYRKLRKMGLDTDELYKFATAYYTEKIFETLYLIFTKGENENTVA